MIEYHKTFDDVVTFLEKGQKVGRVVGQNQLFSILLKIGSLNVFDILGEA